VPPFLAVSALGAAFSAEKAQEGISLTEGKEQSRFLLGTLLSDTVPLPPGRPVSIPSCYGPAL